MSEQLRDSRGMPQPGFIIEHQNSDHKWKVLRNIYSGPFSDVYVVADIATNEKYAMKCERQEGNSRPVLKLDVMVLMATKGIKGFPKFVAAGRTEVYRYCIMQLVGPDLGRLRRTRPERRFSLPTALQILGQTLQRLEDLHNCGWLCRDVKAPNFCIGIGENESTVYILDFGFARKFVDKDGNIIPPRSAAALMGTFQYCAVSAHSHKDQCARDDLESWFYMAIELLKGPLPWANIDGHKNHKLIGDAKVEMRTEPARSEFFEGVPKQFNEILTILDSTTFFDRPDYKKIGELLAEAALENQVTLKEPLDWQNNERMQQKAIFVGELGESHQASAKLDAKDNPNESMDIEFDELPEKEPVSKSVSAEKTCLKDTVTAKIETRKSSKN
uniref:Protein kinase domain-containing protein n=1 Tax=Caenorhabditis tropicalis TaxID=1561998 RepID=A0A1I7U539_9PELO